MENNPLPLTRNDWKEISKNGFIREAYGIDGEEDEEAFSQSRFAVKFNYMSDGPGYAGPLFVVIGGEPDCVTVMIRRAGQLEVVDLPHL
jgi:hypothetical protein